MKFKLLYCYTYYHHKWQDTNLESVWGRAWHKTHTWSDKRVNRLKAILLTTRDDKIIKWATCVTWKLRIKKYIKYEQFSVDVSGAKTSLMDSTSQQQQYRSITCLVWKFPLGIYTVSELGLNLLSWLEMDKIKLIFLKHWLHGWNWI